MQSPIAPASDAVFNAVIYTNGQLAASPQTDQQWQRLRTQALSLRDAGEHLKALSPNEDQAMWARQADALVTSANQTVAAVDAKNLQGVLDAGSSMYATCAACHAAFIKD
jgi:hypothetical protein